MALRTFETLADLAAVAGQEIAVTDWMTINQEQINLFAQATHDHQWIHVDAEKAGASPFGSTIAHGFLTLSLLSALFESALSVRQVRMGLNYGLNKVRFPSPVPVNSRIRGRIKLVSAEPVDNQGLQLLWDVTIEREGGTKPVCIAESLSRMYP
jgi:acyl dehydratase